MKVRASGLPSLLPTSKARWEGTSLSVVGELASSLPAMNQSPLRSFLWSSRYPSHIYRRLNSYHITSIIRNIVNSRIRHHDWYHPHCHQRSMSALRMKRVRYILPHNKNAETVPYKQRFGEQWLEAVAPEHEFEPLNMDINMNSAWYNAMTFVRVAPRTFQVPTAALCFWSPILATRLKKSTPHVLLTLDDIAFEPDVFEVLMQFMYTDRFVYHPRRFVLSDGIAMVYKIWVMAHKLGGACITLRNKCMEQVIAEMTPYYYNPQKIRGYPLDGFTRYLPSPNDVEWVINNVESSAPLPQLLVAALTQNGYQYVTQSLAWTEVLSRCTHLKSILSERRLQIECGARPASLPTDWEWYLGRSASLTHRLLC